MNKKATYISILLMALLIIGCGTTKNLDTLKREGKAALEQGQSDRAISLFREAYKQAPSDRDAIVGLASAYEKALQVDSAYYYYRKAKVLYKNDREVNRKLLQLAPGFKDYDVAFRAIASMVNTGDNEKLYWPQLAELYYLDKQYHKAAEYYSLMIEDDSSNAYNYLSLAGVLSLGQRPDEANKVLLKAVEKFGPRPEYYTNIAVNYANQSKFKEAEKYFRKSLELNHDNVPTWINLANVLTAQKSRDKKLEALQIYKTYKDQTPAFYNLDSVIAGLQTELGVK